MFIYFLLYFIVLVVSFSLTDKKNERLIFIAFLTIFGFLGYFRCFEVGADNVVYSVNFYATTMNPLSFSAYTEFEIGFSWLIAYFKNYITTDYFTFMGLLYVFWMFAFYRFASFFKEGYLLPLFVGISLLFFTHSNNAMRQTFALSLYVIFCMPYLFSLLPLHLESNQQKWLSGVKVNY